ncbi:MAG: hypothetical protein JWM05_2886 [Acidimicrobiales bacterium]|nr:hypothetical protein [Acidimicrobiales bacterium]
MARGRSASNGHVALLLLVGIAVLALHGLSADLHLPDELGASSARVEGRTSHDDHHPAHSRSGAGSDCTSACGVIVLAAVGLRVAGSAKPSRVRAHVGRLCTRSLSGPEPPVPRFLSHA